MIDLWTIASFAAFFLFATIAFLRYWNGKEKLSEAVKWAKLGFAGYFLISWLSSAHLTINKIEELGGGSLEERTTMNTILIAFIIGSVGLYAFYLLGLKLVDGFTLVFEKVEN